MTGGSERPSEIAPLRVSDLGLSAVLIGWGRLGIDIAAAFLFAPLGLAAMFLTFFMAAFALSLAAMHVLDAMGVTFFSANMRNDLLDVSLLGFGATVAGLTLFAALIAGAVTAARVPRLWGLIVTAACVCGAAAFLPTVLVDRTGGGTWTFAVIANAYQYLLPAITVLSLGLLLMGLVLLCHKISNSAIQVIRAANGGGRNGSAGHEERGVAFC